jgi:hydroxymethylglutaryl-CoA synthase
MHGDRFTGEPAFFQHTQAAAERLMQMLGTKASDYKYAVFHQPNVKFPERAAKSLGFSDVQIKPGLLAGEVGNVYAGSCLLGLTATLDVAQPGDHILCVSYGSGAGSDAFDLIVTDKILERRDKAAHTRDYIARRTQIDYAIYSRYRGKMQV